MAKQKQTEVPNLDKQEEKFQKKAEEEFIQI